ncbi:hypothetical protein F5B18DRAFT_628361, partial [Nemania serpens]
MLRITSGIRVAGVGRLGGTRTTSDSSSSSESMSSLCFLFGGILLACWLADGLLSGILDCASLIMIFVCLYIVSCSLDLLPYVIS